VNDAPQNFKTKGENNGRLLPGIKRRSDETANFFMSLEASTIKEMIDTRHLNIVSIAHRVGVTPDYLRRVVNGTMPTTSRMLDAVYRVASRMPSQRTQRDIIRMIDAGATCALVRRGLYASDIWRSGGMPQAFRRGERL